MKIAAEAERADEITRRRRERIPSVLRLYAKDFETSEHLTAPDSDLAPMLRAAADEIERLRRVIREMGD